MKKNNTGKELIIKIMVCMLFFTFFAIVSNTITGHAAGKKEVRVFGIEGLVDAINNKSVGTIILRTDSYDDIVIPANKNAKSKKLIVEAKNCKITNKAVFKSIELQEINKYTEAVSGNVITINSKYLINLEISKKKSLKKLIISRFYGLDELECYMNLKKGAKIKNIECKFGDETYKWDKKTGELTFDYDTEILVYHVEMQFDKSGRLLHRYIKSDLTYGQEINCIYDKNGNILEVNSILDRTDIEYKESIKFSYDSKNRRTSYCVYYPYWNVPKRTEKYYYDSKDREIKVEVDDLEYIDDIEKEYDSKGRLVKEIKNRINISAFEETNGKKSTSTWEYKYDDYGFCVLDYYTSSDSPMYNSTKTYTYDENGDKTVEIFSWADGDGYTVYYEYDEMGIEQKSKMIRADGSVVEH